jgi:hypothetical protein
LRVQLQPVFRHGLSETIQNDTQSLQEAGIHPLKTKSAKRFKNEVGGQSSKSDSIADARAVLELPAELFLSAEIVDAEFHDVSCAEELR